MNKNILITILFIVILSLPLYADEYKDEGCFKWQGIYVCKPIKKKYPIITKDEVQSKKDVIVNSWFEKGESDE